jgi:hypothetical protein
MAVMVVILVVILVAALAPQGKDILVIEAEGVVEAGVGRQWVTHKVTMLILMESLERPLIL